MCFFDNRKRLMQQLEAIKKKIEALSVGKENVNVEVENSKKAFLTFNHGFLGNFLHF